MRRFLLSFTVLTVLASCGDPLADIERLDDVTLAEDAETVAIAAEPDAPGFFARLWSRDDVNAPDTDAPAGEAEILENTEAVETTAPSDIAAAPKRGLFGLFGGRGAASDTATDEPDIAPGTVLPYGEIARNCSVISADMGTQTAAESGFKIFDTGPNLATPRTHYLTGFRDGCARQFTASLALMGDVGTHEVVRYAETGVKLDYSEADNAYEAIKASFCRVAYGQPCGRRLDALARNTTFVTAYEHFEDNARWAEILLHKGEVAAIAIESP